MNAYMTWKLVGIIKDFIQWSLDLEMVTSDDQDSLDRILMKCKEMELICFKDCGQCREYVGEQGEHCTVYATDPHGRFCPCYRRKSST